MSVENVRAFFEKVEANQGLQSKLKELARKQEEFAETEVAKLAATEGFHFSAAELAQVRATPMPDEELAHVAGGALPSKGIILPPKAGETNCCYWAQGCMPGFMGK